MKCYKKIFLLPILVLGVIASPYQALASEEETILQTASSTKDSNGIEILPFGSSYIDFYSVDITHKGNGVLVLNTFFNCRNVSHASIKGTVQELTNNGTWVMVDTFSTSRGSDGSNVVNLQFAKTYNFQKNKSYRATCVFQATKKTGGTETRTSSWQANT